MGVFVLLVVSPLAVVFSQGVRDEVGSSTGSSSFEEL